MLSAVTRLEPFAPAESDAECEDENPPPAEQPASRRSRCSRCSRRRRWRRSRPAHSRSVARRPSAWPRRHLPRRRLPRRRLRRRHLQRRRLPCRRLPRCHLPRRMAANGSVAGGSLRAACRPCALLQLLDGTCLCLPAAPRMNPYTPCVPPPNLPHREREPASRCVIFAQARIGDRASRYRTDVTYGILSKTCMLKQHNHIVKHDL